MWRRAAPDDAHALLAVQILDARDEPATGARIGDTIRLRVFFRAPPDRAGHVAILVKNRYDQMVSNVGSYACGMPAMSSGAAPFAVFQAEIDLMLEAGEYSLMVAFVRPTSKNQGEKLDETGWFGPSR
jgi:hypothetical protein